MANAENIVSRILAKAPQFKIIDVQRNTGKTITVDGNTDCNFVSDFYGIDLSDEYAPVWQGPKKTQPYSDLTITPDHYKSPHIPKPFGFKKFDNRIHYGASHAMDMIEHMTDYGYGGGFVPPYLVGPADARLFRPSRASEWSHMPKTSRRTIERGVITAQTWATFDAADPGNDWTADVRFDLMDTKTVEEIKAELVKENSTDALWNYQPGYDDIIWDWEPTVKHPTSTDAFWGLTQQSWYSPGVEVTYYSGLVKMFKAVHLMVRDVYPTQRIGTYSYFPLLARFWQLGTLDPEEEVPDSVGTDYWFYDKVGRHLLPLLDFYTQTVYKKYLREGVNSEIDNDYAPTLWNVRNTKKLSTGDLYVWASAYTTHRWSNNWWFLMPVPREELYAQYMAIFMQNPKGIIQWMSMNTGHRIDTIEPTRLYHSDWDTWVYPYSELTNFRMVISPFTAESGGSLRVFQVGEILKFTGDDGTTTTFNLWDKATNAIDVTWPGSFTKPFVDIVPNLASRGYGLQAAQEALILPKLLEEVIDEGEYVEDNSAKDLFTTYIPSFISIKLGNYRFVWAYHVATSGTQTLDIATEGVTLKVRAPIDKRGRLYVFRYRN